MVCLRCFSWKCQRTILKRGNDKTGDVLVNGSQSCHGSRGAFFMALLELRILETTENAEKCNFRENGTSQSLGDI